MAPRDTGAFHAGDRTQNESYVDYGSDIIAVADGNHIVLDVGARLQRPARRDRHVRP